MGSRFSCGGEELSPMSCVVHSCGAGSIWQARAPRPGGLYSPLVVCFSLSLYLQRVMLMGLAIVVQTRRSSHIHHEAETIYVFRRREGRDML